MAKNASMALGDTASTVRTLLLAIMQLHIRSEEFELNTWLRSHTIGPPPTNAINVTFDDQSVFHAENDASQALVDCLNKDMPALMSAGTKVEEEYEEYCENKLSPSALKALEVSSFSNLCSELQKTTLKDYQDQLISGPFYEKSPTFTIGNAFILNGLAEDDHDRALIAQRIVQTALSQAIMGPLNAHQINYNKTLKPDQITYIKNQFDQILKTCNLFGLAYTTDFPQPKTLDKANALWHALCPQAYNDSCASERKLKRMAAKLEAPTTSGLFNTATPSMTAYGGAGRDPYAHAGSGPTP